MTRISYLAIGVACLVAGTVLGQAPAEFAKAPAAAIAPAGDWGQACSDTPAHNDWHLWVNADYLLGRVTGDALPALVTTSPAGMARPAAGVLGQPGTAVLFGNTSVNNHQARSGTHVDLGYWFDPDKVFSIETGFFILACANTAFAAASDGTTILARPITDATTGTQSSVPIAFPGTSSGAVQVKDHANNLYGINVDLRENLVASSGWRADALVGYRLLRYDERLSIRQSLQPTIAPFAPGTEILSADSFSTRNIFNGADFGLFTEVSNGTFSLDLLGKIAVGGLRRTVTLKGSQVVNVPGQAPAINEGGLLVLASNQGTHDSDNWAVVSELGTGVGWEVSQNLRVRAGYSILWWPKVARAGEQVDLNVNTAQIPPGTAAAGTPLRPAFTGQTSALWMQALSFGAEIRY